ncbi:MAG: hypothetical protein MZV64_64225 [Ignavibacteriales bacterium]|nr:hypothetical protein [Ignavibacteriales bacterium]
MGDFDLKVIDGVVNGAGRRRARPAERPDTCSRAGSSATTPWPSSLGGRSSSWGSCCYETPLQHATCPRS